MSKSWAIPFFIDKGDLSTDETEYEYSGSDDDEGAPKKDRAGEREFQLYLIMLFHGNNGETH